MSRWFLEVLGQAGIDTTTFCGHSAGSTWCYKAMAGGVPMGEIFKRGFGQTEEILRRIIIRKF